MNSSVMNTKSLPQWFVANNAGVVDNMYNMFVSWPRLFVMEEAEAKAGREDMGCWR